MYSCIEILLLLFKMTFPFRVWLFREQQDFLCFEALMSICLGDEFLIIRAWQDDPIVLNHRKEYFA